MKCHSTLSADHSAIKSESFLSPGWPVSGSLTQCGVNILLPPPIIIVQVQLLSSLPWSLLSLLSTNHPATSKRHVKLLTCASPHLLDWQLERGRNTWFLFRHFPLHGVAVTIREDKHHQKIWCTIENWTYMNCLKNQKITFAKTGLTSCLAMSSQWVGSKPSSSTFASVVQPLAATWLGFRVFEGCQNL